MIYRRTTNPKTTRSLALSIDAVINASRSQQFCKNEISSLLTSLLLKVQLPSFSPPLINEITISKFLLNRILYHARRNVILRGHSKFQRVQAHSFARISSTCSHGRKKKDGQMFRSKLWNDLRIGKRRGGWIRSRRDRTVHDTKRFGGGRRVGERSRALWLVPVMSPHRRPTDVFQIHKRAHERALHTRR